MRMHVVACVLTCLFLVPQQVLCQENSQESFIFPGGEAWYWEQQLGVWSGCYAQAQIRLYGYSIASTSFSFRPYRWDESNWIFDATIIAAKQQPEAGYGVTREENIAFGNEALRQSLSTFAIVPLFSPEESYSGAVIDFSLTDADIRGRRVYFFQYPGLNGVPMIEYTLELRGYSPGIEAFFPEPNGFAMGIGILAVLALSRVKLKI